MRGRLARLLGRRATAAVLGPGTQALAGLALQVAAARLLGAGGLAVFALVTVRWSWGRRSAAAWSATR